MKSHKILCIIVTIMALSFSSSIISKERKNKINVAARIDDAKSVALHISDDYELYAGYPLCSDVIKRAQQEASAIARMLMHTELDSILDARLTDCKNYDPTLFPLLKSIDIYVDVPSSCPSHAVKAENNSIRAPQIYNWGGGSCFTGDMQVFRLMQKGGFFSDDIPMNEKRLNYLRDENPEEMSLYSEPIPMAELYDEYRDDFTNTLVLSSTYPIFEDRHYQKDCWAEFGEVKKFENDKQYNRITASWGQDKFVIKVMGKHRIYSKSSELESYKWTTAETVGSILYSGDNVTGTKVIDNDRFFPSWLFNNENGGKEVYTLVVPNIFTYYIGTSLTNKILVHD